MTEIQGFFIANLKILRKEANLSQEQFAEKVGLSPKYISAIEIGNRFPSPKALQRIVDVLKTQPYRLFLDPEQKDFSSEVQAIENYSNYLEDEIRKHIKQAKKDFLQEK